MPRIQPVAAITFVLLTLTLRCSSETPYNSAVGEDASIAGRSKTGLRQGRQPSRKEATMEQEDRPVHAYPTHLTVQSSNAIRRRRQLQSSVSSCNWHPDITSQDGCSNDDNYPEEWLVPRIAATMFTSTSQQCCDFFFPNSDCKVYDRGCQTPPPPAPQTNPPPSPNAKCVSPGWHPDIKRKDGCTNDDHYPDQWLISAQMKSNMFKASSQLCCDMFFNNRECKVYDLGCDIDPNMTESSKPTPEPTKQSGNPTKMPTREPTSSNPTATPKASQTNPQPYSNAKCVIPGWHPDINSNDGCTNDDRYPDQWLMSVQMKSNMFKASSQLCCDQFFNNKECKVYDLGCDIDPNMTERPKPTPKPTRQPGSPTQKPTHEPTSSNPTVTPKEFYIAHGEGICLDAAESPKPYYIMTTYRDIESCCHSSFAKDKCFAAIPDDWQSDIQNKITTPEYYIGHGDGICLDDNETPKPYYITTTFSDIITCCQSSFAKDNCFASIPNDIDWQSDIPDKMIEISMSGSISLHLSTVPVYNSSGWAKLKNIISKSIASVMLKSPISSQGIVVNLLTFAGQSFEHNFSRRLDKSTLEIVGTRQNKAKRRAYLSQTLQFEMKIPTRCNASCQYSDGPQVAFDELKSHLQYYITSGVFSYVLRIMGETMGLFDEADVTFGSLVYQSAVDSLDTLIPTWSPTEEPPPIAIPTISPSGDPTQTPSFQPSKPSPTTNPTPEPIWTYSPTSPPTTECDAAKWYFKLGERLCTNDSFYPSLWEGTKLLFNTAEECCETYNSGMCAVKDVCEMEIPYCGGLYHPTTPDLRTCTNSYEYPPAWDNNPRRFLFHSAGACCEAFYSDGMCLIKTACY